MKLLMRGVIKGTEFLLAHLSRIGAYTFSVSVKKGFPCIPTYVGIIEVLTYVPRHSRFNEKLNIEVLIGLRCSAW